MTQILSTDRQGLIFEIISARIAEQPEDKKYVIYTLQVRFVSGSDDLTPSVIERRYTQFQNLYNSLRKDFPSLLADISFPKKVLTGNFDNELISTRSTAFESVLKRISEESKLRMSRPMQVFLQEPELTEAKELFEKQSYDSSLEMLQNILKLLNKVFSDRSHAVLLILCRLVAYYAEVIPAVSSSQSLKWADLALYRFDGVSDSDLLKLYLPLLYACITIYKANDKNTESLETQLEHFRRKGVRDDKERTLLIVLNELEKEIF